jgi:hypothetical protein
VGRPLSDDRAELARQLSACDPVLPVSGRDPACALYDQRGRVAQLQPAENYQESEPVPERRGGFQAALPGLEKHREKMDDADQGMEACAATIRDRI